MPITPPHIYIIGAGAIGQALAVFLRLAGREVTLIRGSIPTGACKTEHIRVEMTDGTHRQAAITVTTLAALPTLQGLLVLATKSFGNEQLAKALQGRTGNSPLLLLQNGLGVEQPFLRQQFPEVYRGVLFVTSQAIAPFTLRFKPVAVCPVGIEQGDGRHLDNLISQLSTPDFSFKSEANIQQVIWKKALVNCVFNSVCPLLEADNGIFHRNEAAYTIARRVIAEGTAIARAKGILLQEGEVTESLLQISRLSDGQDISTLQDIRLHRRTEIETLNPEIVRLAERLGLADLVPETRLLGELTRLKADLSLLAGQKREAVLS